MTARKRASSGVARGGGQGGGHLPPGTARRGRQNPAKEFLKIYIR